MSDYSLTLVLFDIGKFLIKINKSHCPRTVSAIEKILPIRSRGIKRSNKFIITSDLKTRGENEQNIFDAGEVSVDPSSGNITVYLENIQLINSLNFLGKIEEFDRFDKLKLSNGIEIRENPNL